MPLFSKTKDHRQLQHHGHVQRLEGQALVRSAVAGEGDGHPVGPERLGRQRRTDHQRRPTADDAVRAEHAHRQVGDVHRATLAPAQTLVLAEDLAHHRPDAAALGQAVAVAAVGGGDVVGVAQGVADADGNGLLPGVQVDEPGDVAGGVLQVQRILEGPDLAHPPVGPDQNVGGIPGRPGGRTRRCGDRRWTHSPSSPVTRE
jgi:hypothetical protein